MSQNGKLPEQASTQQRKPSSDDYHAQLRIVLPQLTAELLHRFKGTEAYELFSDVKPTFAELTKRGIATNIVSNSDDAALMALRDLGLAEYMRGSLHWSSLTAAEERARDTSASSRDSGGCTISYFEGVEKPDRRIFEAALVRNNVDLSDEGRSSVVYVGDQIEDDFWGAKGAGLHALWLNRGAESNQPEKGDRVERSEAERQLVRENTIGSLTEVIERLGDGAEKTQ